MENIREILGNATMAHTTMDTSVNEKNVVKSILDILKEAQNDIEKVNEIDVKNKNGFKIDFQMFEVIENKIKGIDSLYRKVIDTNKNKDEYLEGRQMDNLGTICVAYDGNTYCLIEMALKSILTHNAIILTCENEYMKDTNELTVTLIQRILDAYHIDKNLVQIYNTANINELLKNSASINKVIAIGDRNFQEKIKKASDIEVVCNGYNNYDVYIEDTSHIDLVEKVIEENDNVDIYVKKGIKVPFDDYAEVEDLDEAIGIINFNTSGYSSSIFSENAKNGAKFIREIKTNHVCANSSPILKNTTDVGIQSFLMTKHMLFLNSAMKSNPNIKRDIVNNTVRSSFEEHKKDEQSKIIAEVKAENERLQRENFELRKNNQELKSDKVEKIEHKEEIINELIKQLQESQNISGKYMDILESSFFSRFFGNLKKAEIEQDKKLLS